MKMVIPQEKKQQIPTTRDISQIMPRDPSSHEESEDDAKYREDLPHSKSHEPGLENERMSQMLRRTKSYHGIQSKSPGLRKANTSGFEEEQERRTSFLWRDDE